MARLTLLAAGVALATAGAGWATAYTWRTEASGAPWSITGDVRTAADLRFEVRAGDRAPWDLAHHHVAERAEISDFANKEPVGSDIWFAFDLTVEPGPAVSSGWLVLGQLHATEDPGTPGASPPWAEELDRGDVFRIVIRSSDEAPLRRNPPATVLFSDPAFQRGHTYHLVYQLRYSPTAGRLRTWRDGRQIVDYAGPLGYPTAQGPYFKFGIYRKPAPETLVVRYAGLRFGGPELQPQ